MARDDEFNHVQVTNEQQLRGVEFGLTQNTEFSFQNVKRSGINDQPTNELNEEVQEVKNTRKTRNVLEEEKDLIEKATESSNASAPTTATTSGVSAGANSAGAAAASGGVTAAAASTAAAAGTVVVAAFAVVTAAPVIISHATATLKYFEAYENEVFYEVELKDTLDDEKYYVILSNKTYNQEQELEFEPEQEFVSGVFNNLEPNQDYTFEVIEGSDASEITRSLLKKNIRTASYAPVQTYTVAFYANGGTGEMTSYSDVSGQFLLPECGFIAPEGMVFAGWKINGEGELYEPGIIINIDSSITLFAQWIDEITPIPDSVFNSVTIYPEANFVTGEFSIKLDYVDEKKQFSNFSLLLTDGEIEYVYQLDEVTTVQTKNLKESGDSKFYLYGEFTYTFTYTDNGIDKSIQGEPFMFTDVSGAISTLDGVSIDPSADFLDNKISVILSYTDELENLYGFKLHLSYTDVTGGTNEEEYYLSRQTTAQIVETDEILPYEGTTFSYYATCEGLDGELRTDVKQVAFIDSENRQSIFNGATLHGDEADFDNNLIYVTLDYVDGFSRFDYAELVLANIEGQTFVYQLQMTTEKQSVNINNLQGDGETTPRPPVISSGETFTYTFRYYLKGDEPGPIELNSGEVTFTDPSKFNYSGLTFGYADFEEKTIEVTLNYVGSTDGIYSLELELMNDDTSCSATLRKDTTKQDVLMNDGLDLEHGSFSYELRAYYDESFENVEVIDSGSGVTFTDINNRTTQIRGISFETDQEGHALANSGTGTFNVTLDYDDYFNQYASFALLLYAYPDGSGTGPTSDMESNTFYLESTTASQPVTYLEYFNIFDYDEISYELQYSTIDDAEQLVTTESGKVSFIDNATEQVVGFEHGNLVESPDSNDYFLPFKFAIGEKHDSDSIRVKVIDTNNVAHDLQFFSDTGNAELDEVYQLGYFSHNEGETWIDGTVTFQVYYEYYDGESHEVVIYETTDTLILDQGGDFEPLGLRLYSYFTGDNYIAYFMYNGAFSEDSEVHLKFVFESDSQVYEDGYLEEPSGYGRPMAPTITSEELRNRLSNAEAFALYIVYKDSSGTTQEVLCYKNYFFQV